MYKNIFVFFIYYFLFVTEIFSQNIESKDFNLNWKQSAVYVKSGVQVTIPLLDNEIFDENLLPVFSTAFNAESGLLLQGYELVNVKYENININSLPPILQNSLPDGIKPHFSLEKSPKGPLVRLRMHPLFREGEIVKKVVSFSVVYRQPPQLLAKRDAPPPVYKQNAVLSTGTWYKFEIEKSGLYKIDKDFLGKLGIPTANLNPKQLRIFGNGGAMLPQGNDEERYEDLQENAIYVFGEEDNTFDNGDYALLYAQGPDEWQLDPGSLQNSRHQKNIYADKATYFITTDQGPGLRIENTPAIDNNAAVPLNTYQDFFAHELEERNLFANGQQWLGEDLSFTNSKSYTLDFSGLVPTDNLYARLRGVSVSSTVSNMTLNINGQKVIDLAFSPVSNNSLRLASTAEGLQSILQSNPQLNITVTFNNNGNPSAKGYLDYFEIFGTRRLSVATAQFSFRNFSATNPNQVYKYTLQNNQNIDAVWDITNMTRPKRMSGVSSGTDYTFNDYGHPELREYIVVHKQDLFTPKIPASTKVRNQNLHRLRDIEYLVITQPFLMNEAKRLADHHTKNNGLTAEVVDLNEVYNEFASGSPDLTAIRDFVRYLYLNASTPENRIKYVCLFGDASFDFKDRINDNDNIVPAFQSYESFDLARGYVTDDYYGMMDESDGYLGSFDNQEVATGRIPVSTLSEAKNAVDKILSYYKPASFGDWHNQITVVADDPDTSGEFVLQQTVDLIAQDIESNKPVFNIKKIYADAYPQETSAGGERYPAVNQAIDNAVESGTLLVNYFGHGGVDGWANERILEVPQIQSWKNFSNLPLFVTVTCEFARFDNPLRPTAGEYTFLNPAGGSMSMISTTREIFISTGQIFNRALVRDLLQFDGQQSSIAESLIQTKNQTSSTQKYFIYFFGDPAMNLSMAKPNIRITKMNDIPIESSLDTLKALSKISFEGLVTDGNGQPITNFNGELSTLIFDKALQKKTLDNDNFGRTMDFVAIESKIFRGRATVNSGKFQFTFVVPKDIRIAYGKAKMSFYAHNTEENIGGYNFDVVIGGIDTEAPDDQLGPEISLYLNDESFTDGGNTNASPVLIAKLSDASGINTSITAVDHDIIAILDNDEANPIILNDFYKTELDDFTKGTVKYSLRDLKPGMHTIKFKCWDTYNNLSESALNFVVVDESGLVLSNVLNYPNPFVNYTEFWFNHNKPNELLEAQVQIYTISGKLVKTVQAQVQTAGNLSRELTWDGLDDFGNKIGKGVYVYKLKVKATQSNLTKEKIEKLVIL